MRNSRRRNRVWGQLSRCDALNSRMTELSPPTRGPSCTHTAGDWPYQGMGLRYSNVSPIQGRLPSRTQPQASGGISMRIKALGCPRTEICART